MADFLKKDINVNDLTLHTEALGKTSNPDNYKHLHWLLLFIISVI